MTVAEALLSSSNALAAAGFMLDEARVDARILLLHTADITPESVYLRPNAPLPEAAVAALADAIARRVRHEPLAYIIGTWDFYGLSFFVSSAVLIPRPETEFVVEAALEHVKGRAKAKIADIGTGSGAIAVSVGVHAPQANLWASDISLEAMTVARANAARHGLTDRIAFAQGDLIAPAINGAPFDVVASNPPYVAPSEIENLEAQVRDWEPRIALGTHEDPLHYYRRLAAEAPALLVSGGLLVVEVGQGQADSVAGLWKKSGLTDISIRPDYAGIPRVVSGVR